MTENLKKVLKILLLEDKESDAVLISHHLKALPFPFEMTHASNRTDFVHDLEKTNPDIILADYNLPSYTGLEALIESQQVLPYVPFIFITGTIGAELAEETILNGASGFVLKSDLEKLSKIISHFFGVKDENEQGRVRQNIKQTEKEIKKLKRIVKAANKPVKETASRIDATLKKMEESKKSFLKKDQ